MSVAQHLYEGVETGEGHIGLITYMRTDSTAIAGVAMGEAREVIADRYGPTYTMPKGRVYKTKSKGAQEAHESIRPTSFRRDPDSLADHLKPEELRLYRLIWQRALASQMAAKELETTSIDLADGPYELRASATKVLFDGFARVYTEGRDDDAADDEDEGAKLPALVEGDRTSVVEVTPNQHFTEPPPRFTEATLIKALEEHGIGRPSTYAATISTIVDRGYVRVEERRLHPELVAEIVTDLLVEHFGDYVDVEFTARMEEELDEIARGEREWVPLLRAFYGPLRDRVDEKRRELKRADFTTEPTDEVCSEGHPMVIRLGRNGRFLACSMYPRAQGEPTAAGRGAAAPGGDRRGLPQVRRGDARRQARPVRAVRGLLAVPRVRLHQARRPAAARSAPVHGRLPQEPRRPPRAASRAAHRKRLLGMLQLPEVRLHDQRRAAGRPARHRRRPDRAQGRGCHLPGLRLDERHGARGHRARRALCGRTGEPGRDRPTGTHGARRRRFERRRGDGPVDRPARPVGAPAGRHAPSNRPPTREWGRRRPRDPFGPRSLPPDPRRTRRVAPHAAVVRDGDRGLPRAGSRPAASTGGHPVGPTSGVPR